MNNKTVVTGMGMITSLGLNLDETWENIVAGKNGIHKINRFDASNLETQIGGEINDEIEEIAASQINRRTRKQMTRGTRILMVAANEAIKNSNIDFSKYDKKRVAVIMGIVSTGYDIFEKEKSESNMVVKSMPNAPSAWISLEYGLEGPNFSVATACASSAYAIALGHQMIQAGMMDVVIVGGVDTHLEPEYIRGFNQILAMSSRNDSPETACRPFTKSRDGFVMGEGAGVMVLEAEKFARDRGASIYGEIGGYALTSEAVNITAPKEDGEGMLLTMIQALENAGIQGKDVDYINAHGTSTHLNDKYETLAIKKCFGKNSKNIPVSSSKSMIGHTIAAAGAIEGIITLMSIKNSILTPTINYNDPDPELDLDYVPNVAREKEINVALSNSFGFGGHNATIVYKKYKL